MTTWIFPGAPGLECCSDGGLGQALLGAGVGELVGAGTSLIEMLHGRTVVLCRPKTW